MKKKNIKRLIVFGDNTIGYAAIKKELIKYKVNEIICFNSLSTADNIRKYCNENNITYYCYGSKFSLLNDAAFSALFNTSMYWLFFIRLNDSPLRFRGLVLALQNIYANEKLKTVVI